MKAFKARLKALGFKAVTRSLFACRAGKVVHAVSVVKDRYGDVMIHATASPSGFFSDQEPFAQGLYSPVGGDVSPRGVISSWSWSGELVDTEVALTVLLGFLARFASLEDVRRAVEGIWIHPHAQACLSLDGPAAAMVEALPLASYPVPGGAVSLDSAVAMARVQLAGALEPLGFVMANCSDVVALRKRGAMADGVRAVLDSFGTHVTLSCFPWPDAVARADKRWKDSPYPMVPYDVVHEDGSLALWPLDSFCALAPDQLRALLAPGIACSSSVADHLAFAALLDGQWSTVASGLRHIPLTAASSSEGMT